MDNDDDDNDSNNNNNNNNDNNCFFKIKPKRSYTFLDYLFLKVIKIFVSVLKWRYVTPSVRLMFTQNARKIIFESTPINVQIVRLNDFSWQIIP